MVPFLPRNVRKDQIIVKKKISPPSFAVQRKLKPSYTKMNKSMKKIKPVKVFFHTTYGRILFL